MCVFHGYIGAGNEKVDWFFIQYSYTAMDIQYVTFY